MLNVEIISGRDIPVGERYNFANRLIMGAVAAIKHDKNVRHRASLNPLLEKTLESDPQALINYLHGVDHNGQPSDECPNFSLLAVGQDEFPRAALTIRNDERAVLEDGNEVEGTFLDFFITERDSEVGKLLCKEALKRSSLGQGPVFATESFSKKAHKERRKWLESDGQNLDEFPGITTEEGILSLVLGRRLYVGGISRVVNGRSSSSSRHGILFSNPYGVDSVRSG